MAVFYVDGEYVDESCASIPVMDLSVIRGYGIFDFLRTYSGIPFHLEDHIKRFRNSASITGIDFPWSDEELKRVVDETILRNGFKESNIRLIATGGETNDGITPKDEPRLLVMVTELTKMPDEWYREGVKIVTSKTWRYFPDAKTTNYLPAIIDLKKAKEADAVESVYLSSDNKVLEGTTSNLFFVFDGRLVTAGDGILEGVTRKVVLENYKGNEIEIRDIDVDEIKKAEEAFLTSSNKEICPVVIIDDIEISKEPGKITKDVMGFFRDYIEKGI